MLLGCKSEKNRYLLATAACQADNLALAESTLVGSLPRNS